MTTCDPIGTSGLQGEAMAMRTVRMRGMEPPYAQDQIAAFVLHPVISAAFIALAALSLTRTTIGVVLAPFLLLSVVVVGLWMYISWTDPAGEGGCPLKTKGVDTPHYCNYCRKTVKGFDHHCSWLNTCISVRNYAHFYMLGVSGSLLYAYMTTVGVLAMVLVEKDEQRDALGSLTAYRVAWGVFVAVAGWIAVSFVALAGFHTYLLWKGLGTYDWVLLQNQKRQELLARRRNERVDSSQFECCGRNGSQRRPAISSVQDVEGGSVTSGGSRPPSLSLGLGAKRGIPTGGSWGGAGMGIGVTPTRSRVVSSAGLQSSNGGSGSALGSARKTGGNGKAGKGADGTGTPARLDA